MREINIVKLRIVCQMYDEEINGRENEKKNHRTNINLQHQKKNREQLWSFIHSDPLQIARITHSHGRKRKNSTERGVKREIVRNEYFILDTIKQRIKSTGCI